MTDSLRTSSLVARSDKELLLNELERILLARAKAERVISDVDDFGLRLTQQMSGPLYIAVANYRRAAWEEIKKRSAETEE